MWVLKSSPNPSLVDQVINQNSSLVNPALSKSEFCESILKKPLVEKMVDLAPPLVKRTLPVESEPHTA